MGNKTGKNTMTIIIDSESKLVDLEQGRRRERIPFSLIEEDLTGVIELDIKRQIDNVSSL